MVIKIYFCLQKFQYYELLHVMQTTSQPTCPGGAQLGLPTWKQDGLEPGFQVGSKWASPFIKKISFTYALF